MPMAPQVMRDKQPTRGGGIESASLDLPAVDPDTGQPYTRLVFTTTLADTDAQNPVNKARFTVQASWDQGNTFEVVGGPYNWQGGIGPKGNFTVPSETVPIPTKTINNVAVQPDTMKVVMDTLGSLLNTDLLLNYDSVI